MSIRDIKTLTVRIIKARTRSQWRAWLRSKLLRGRDWVQDNGEKAAVIGVMVGVTLVLFFELLVCTAVMALVLWGVMMLIADE